MAHTQTLRFRGPNSKPASAPVQQRKEGLLKDQVKRYAKLPWSPTFAFALRMILLVRVSSAMYSNIDDCDEVYNFWEPLHFLDHGYAFQTWETSPQYAIRSWAYILLHIFPTSIARFLAADQKRVAFFAVRIFLAAISSIAEVTLYRKVYEKVNHRVGRYLFFMLLFNAGMWNASAAFLPSSFAMYTGTLAFAYSISPSTSTDSQRTLLTTLFFASGAIAGWPFALALAIPFVFEELFILSGDKVLSSARSIWMVNRWKRQFGCGVLAALIFVPVIGIDSMAYGRLSLVPFNIVKYNILSSDRGPDLYGTSPWTFYFLNLLLNFNVILPFALLALPALAITYLVDRNRLGVSKNSAEESSPFTVLALRLAPVYIWLGILTAQPHKEERFMFPAYPMLCFNAAVTLYLVRGWMETAFVAATKSPYRASRSSIFSTFTLSVLTTTAVLSLSRVAANWMYYHSPLSISNHFEAKELPHLLDIAGFLPVHVERQSKKGEERRVDLSPIKDFNLTLCYGKEWHRFPGHYLVPDGVKVEFIKSEFDGLLPGHFSAESTDFTTSLWPRPQTRVVPQDQNDLNREELSHYVPVSICTHLIDLDFPSHPLESLQEPRYAIQNDVWERVECLPFLDAQHSPLFSRVIWLPGQKWRSINAWGDYCLLRNRQLVAEKVEKVKQLEVSRRGFCFTVMEFDTRLVTSLLNMPADVTLHIFSYLDLPELAALAQVSPYLATLASNPALHKNRLRVVAPSRIQHSLFGQGPQGAAFRPTIAELVHRGVMKGLSIERHLREGTYFYSHRSISQYETSLKLARNRACRIISMQLRQRERDTNEFLKTLHQAHVLPDEESSSIHISRSLLPVMRKLKWSIQRDNLSKKIRTGTVYSISGSSIGPLEVFGRWLESRAKAVVYDRDERVRLAICPDIRLKVGFYERLG
ncbi:hypothetical protein D9757_004689 [Collybiopsis confluens]|uniref:Mannosyltransferase n=1 Tax=Collybiopsis confluens TaxID=2823264 RepID=A0A8H5HS96_9AGAR|nr:hypothetical protein D9757_004689 [Collybiopsis confluens]